MNFDVEQRMKPDSDRWRNWNSFIRAYWRKQRLSSLFSGAVGINSLFLYISIFFKLFIYPEI